MPMRGIALARLECAVNTRRVLRGDASCLPIQ
jgi:hypothetical protein